MNFDYLVMPQRTGTLTIAPLTISFFDAESGRYSSTRTDAVTLQVEPGEAGETSLRPEGGELRPLKEEGLGLRARAPVTSSPLFWLLQLIPTAGLGWALLRRRSCSGGSAIRAIGDLSRLRRWPAPVFAACRNKPPLAKWHGGGCDAGRLHCG